MEFKRKKTSSISSWLLAVVQAFESYGHDADLLLAQAGIDKNILLNPDARISLEAMSRVWEIAVSVTGDQCFGLHVASFVKPTTFHALGFAMMASNSLNDAISRVRRNYNVITTAIDLEIGDSDGLVSISFMPKKTGTKPADEAVDAMMASAVSFCRMMLNDEIRLLKTELIRKKPEHSEKFINFFNSPVIFSAEQNRFYINKEDCHRFFPTANIEIARHNEQIVREYLKRFQKNDIAYQVNAKVIEILRMGSPSLEGLATALGISKRNLNRYLKNENTTYQEILSEVRQYLAVKYFKQKNLSITDIAFRLGYTDSSNFSRAFKRWFGISPKDYRGKEKKP